MAEEILPAFIAKNSAKEMAAAAEHTGPGLALDNREAEIRGRGAFNSHGIFVPSAAGDRLGAPA